jgi:hypothetical protein
MCGMVLNMSDYLQYVLPPEHRAGILHPETPEPVVVDHGHYQEIAAPQGNQFAGRTARTWTSKRGAVRVNDVGGVTNGNFSADIIMVESGVIADHAIISVPVNGIVYSFNFGGQPFYYLDTVSNFWQMNGEIIVCNMPGSSIAMCTPIPLQPRRQHCNVGIWSNQAVPQGFQANFCITYINLGGAS